MWGTGARAMLVLATLALANGQANAAAAPRSRAGEACELHIIPGGAFFVNDQTDIPMGGVLPALLTEAIRIKRPKTVEQLMQDRLSPATQVRIFSEPDTFKSLKMDLKIIFEDVARAPQLKNFKDLYTLPRLTSSTASCYKELIVYGSAVFRSFGLKMFNTTFAYRSFGPGTAPIYSVVKTAESGLRRFPPRASEEDIEPALLELEAAFRQNVFFFLSKKLKHP